MNNRLILPSAYLPSISYVSAIFRSYIEKGDVVIDRYENYVKRSQRNRAQIMTAQGVMDLTVPVHNANTPRQPMHTIKIDNSKRWQHQHWIAIKSAYKSSPYFDHYEPYFEPIFKQEWCSLTELNEALLKIILKLLNIDSNIEKSTIYIESSENDIDLRKKVSKESSKESSKNSELFQTSEDLQIKEYIQVFEDRQPFAPNLSIIDLLLCEGPAATTFL